MPPIQHLRGNFRVLATPLALLFSLGLVQPASLAAPLPEPVLAALQKANIPPDAMAVWAMPLNGAAATTTLASHQASRLMQPASTMKLVTTIVALDNLGRIYRGKTELRGIGAIENGVLPGLVIRGLADADLDLDAFANLLKTLRKKGVNHIAGNVTVDRTLFQPARLDVGLPPFDEAPEFQYNVIPDALLLNFNLLSLDMDSSSGAFKANIGTPFENVSLNTSKMQHLQLMNVAFSNEPESTYVSISGHGEVVTDRARIESLWTPFARPWFPDGVDSTNLALLKFIPHVAEYWDAPDSKMVRMFTTVLSIAAAKPIGMSEHGVLDITNMYASHFISGTGLM